MSTDTTIPVRTYGVVFVSLLILLFASVALAFIPTGENHKLRDGITAMGYAIAGAKTLLIIVWFMHLKFARKVTWIAAAAGFIWLAILIGLSLTDYGTRNVPGNESAQIGNISKLAR